VYFTDRGIEELEDRRGDDQVTLGWLADRMRAFVDQNPDFEDAMERLATYLARDDSDELDDATEPEETGDREEDLATEEA
jgi:hypothetical protein